MLWYSLVKRFEQSEAVERFERFELASAYFGSDQAISLLEPQIRRNIKYHA